MLVASSDTGLVAVAGLAGAVAGAIVTGVIGPIVADLQARKETYRNWQRDLANAVLDKVHEIRTKVESAPQARSPRSSDDRDVLTLVNDLDVLAQRAALVFSHDFHASEWASEMVEALRKPDQTSEKVNALRKPDQTPFDVASQQFVKCASNEIRGRHWWERERDPFWNRG
jgi:hypothetical protein